MLRYAFFGLINVALAFHIMAQTTPEGDMLASDYRGLAYAVFALFAIAIVQFCIFIGTLFNDPMCGEDDDDDDDAGA